ncbi:methylated-DNA--protein-cysteine methyltransferase isoform X5 [Prionailurus iriomotensis]
MPGQRVVLQPLATLCLQLLVVGALVTRVCGRMDKTCEMNYKVVDSPLGEIEISACEQGVHEIRLHGRKTPDAGGQSTERDSFTRQVLWKLLKVVRLGETVSYRQLAALAGRPRAARAVGGAMRTNPLPILIPCHRVVCSSGAMGNYSAGR